LVVVFALLFFFLIITFLCTAGGALGAKLVGGVTGPGPESGHRTTGLRHATAIGRLYRFTSATPAKMMAMAAASRAPKGSR
jgi:hypothetical protein